MFRALVKPDSYFDSSSCVVNMISYFLDSSFSLFAADVFLCFYLSSSGEYLEASKS